MSVILVLGNISSNNLNQVFPSGLFTIALIFLLISLYISHIKFFLLKQLYGGAVKPKFLSTNLSQIAKLGLIVAINLLENDGSILLNFFSK